MKTIVFDIGRVLVKFDWQAYLNSLFTDEKEKAAVNRAFWEIGLWREMDRGAIPQEHIYQALLKQSQGFEEQMKLAYDRIGECIGKTDYAGVWIKELKERGYRVLFLSNYSDYLIEKNREALSFLELMDGGIFSCHVKLLKPDLKIYETLFEKYDLTPSDCLFLDDMPVNILGAKECGMNGIVFTTYEETRPKVEAFLERWEA
ncbi:MAG: HAD family phosphatase [Lachnospiraceae bacterium]|nr:HAD family phosphatase [Lachnospiraceae bacterium]